MARSMRVWMNGVSVGVWSSTSSGTPLFTYDSSWMQSDATRALSLSLPMTTTREIRGEVVDNYFDNLLPDSAAIRKRLASRFKVKSNEAFDLLAAIGRDCVGAVQLLPDDAEPRGWDRINAELLSENEIVRHIHSMTSSRPLGAEDPDSDFRISIAGAQEKTALLRMGGRWYRPVDATPTTHIIKLPMGLVGNMQADMSMSVENEWLCAQIVGECGVPIARTEMARFGDEKALVVERFDRRWQGATAEQVEHAKFRRSDEVWIARLPQEDFCQAMGLPTHMKYESDKGPGIETCLRLLAGSENSTSDRVNFITAQFVFWLLAATDGHGKNFSLHHHRGSTYSMTPLYDVISAWPIIGRAQNQVAYQKAKLAMAVRGKSAHYRLSEIRARHWMELAQRYGVPQVWKRLTGLTSTIEQILSRVEKNLPKDFPALIWDKNSEGMRKHASQFAREAESLTGKHDG